jgi:hypothetical protein
MYALLDRQLYYNIFVGTVTTSYNTGLFRTSTAGQVAGPCPGHTSVKKLIILLLLFEVVY